MAKTDGAASESAGSTGNCLQSEGDPLKALVKPHAANRRIPAAILRAVYHRAQGRCESCGERCGLQVHHIIPISEGGDHSLENLRLLCRSCHDATHHDDFEYRPDWQAARQSRLAERSLSGHDP
ncbi:MAG TPA: HNH endonuclease signature motif containing protein [Candidatus Xenobia bacterium]